MYRSLTAGEQKFTIYPPYMLIGLSFQNKGLSTIFSKPNVTAARTAAYNLLFKRVKRDIHSLSQHKEADMGRAYSLNVLAVGVAFVFVASMLFI
jgi:hypothetical protein